MAINRWTNVAWLISRMNGATHRGELATCTNFINYCKEENQEYTRCEDTMIMLRKLFQTNLERIEREEETNTDDGMQATQA